MTICVIDIKKDQLYVVYSTEINYQLWDEFVASLQLVRSFSASLKYKKKTCSCNTNGSLAYP